MSYVIATSLFLICTLHLEADAVFSWKKEPEADPPAAAVPGYLPLLQVHKYNGIQINPVRGPPIYLDSTVPSVSGGAASELTAPQIQQLDLITRLSNLVPEGEALQEFDFTEVLPYVDLISEDSIDRLSFYAESAKAPEKSKLLKFVEFIKYLKEKKLKPFKLAASVGSKIIHKKKEKVQQGAAWLFGSKPPATLPVPVVPVVPVNDVVKPPTLSYNYPYNTYTDSFPQSFPPQTLPATHFSSSSSSNGQYAAPTGLHQPLFPLDTSINVAKPSPSSVYHYGATASGGETPAHTYSTNNQNAIRDFAFNSNSNLSSNPGTYAIPYPNLHAAGSSKYSQNAFPSTSNYFAPPPPPPASSYSTSKVQGSNFAPHNFVDFSSTGGGYSYTHTFSDKAAFHQAPANADLIASGSEHVENLHDEQAAGNEAAANIVAESAKLKAEIITPASIVETTQHDHFVASNVHASKSVSNKRTVLHVVTPDASATPSATNDQIRGKQSFRIGNPRTTNVQFR